MMDTPTGTGVATGVHTRKITVTNTTILQHRPGKWTLFAISANDEVGDPITMEMRSFQKLSGTIECTFEPYAKVPGSWTLSEVGDARAVSARRSAARAKLTGTNPAPAAATPDLTALLARMDDLERRFETLKTIVAEAA